MQWLLARAQELWKLRQKRSWLTCFAQLLLEENMRTLIVSKIIALRDFFPHIFKVTTVVQEVQKHNSLAFFIFQGTQQSITFFLCFLPTGLNF
jgi:hypothetical protein